MKKTYLFVLSLLLLTTMALAQTPAGQTGDTPMKKEAPKKAKKESAPAPPAAKSDADVQKCISDKFAAAEKLKSQGFTATVTNGEATLTGTALNAGSKGAATKIAKSCGVKNVKNEITAPPVQQKPAKSEEKKSGDAAAPEHTKKKN